MPSNNRILPAILAGLAAVTMPVLVGAQAPRTALPPHKGPHPSQTRAVWDGKVQGRQVVTALSASFEDEQAYRDFAAGRIPFTLTLRSAASGQTVRIPAAQLSRGHYPSVRLGANNRAIWVIAIDQLRAPLWDSNGCIETTTAAEVTGDGRGAAITLTYAPCGAAPAPGGPIGPWAPGSKNGRIDSRQRVAAVPTAGSIRCPGDILCSVLLGASASQAMTAGVTIPGVEIVVKKNPGGGAARVVVSGGASEVTEGDQTARLQLVQSGALVIRASRGEATPQRSGF